MGMHVVKSTNSQIHDKLIKAIELQNSGEAKKASVLFLQILKMQPDNFFALYSIAAIESNDGKNAAALSYANRAIAANKQFTQAYFARSMIYLKLGKTEEALADIDATLRIDANFPNAEEQRQILLAAASDPLPPSAPLSSKYAELNTKAINFQSEGKLDKASMLFEKILTLDPTDFIALYSMGVIAGKQGNHDLALTLLTQAVHSAPTNAQGYYALASTLQSLALFESALETFDQALALNPGYMEAYNNKATLLHSMNRHLEALQTIDAGLAISPQDQKSLNNKGYILTEFKQNSVAALVFKSLLDINPDYEYAEGLHTLARLHCCDWTDFEKNKQRITDGVRAGKRVCNPFALMAMSDSAEDNLHCAEIFGQHRFPQAKELLWQGEVYRHRKKRVAFISADFREHPVGYLLIGMIENLDKSQLETVGISVGIRDNSELYRRYRNAFDHYLDCVDKAPKEIAKLMRAMEIDVAIDLSGYTSGSRLDILSHRPAPAQATYLGFPGGLNVPYVDYLIADRITIPEESQQYYREKILYLPHCYLPRDTSVRPADSVPSKFAFGLPEQGTVFCNFNHDYKINPPVFSTWMDLLRENKNSVLWLMKLNEDAQNNLLKSAAFYDVDPKRLVFARRVPRVEDHLARYRHVDVFLDTFPYNGHTTASDALFAGTPVVTMRGASFASRVASSLLSDIGRTEWSTTGLEAYRQTAQSIVDSGKLSEKKLINTHFECDRIDERKQAARFTELLHSINSNF
jgi:predicted O-linked N-acetylglucosamine transferase (SPINDLY family)